MRLSEQLPSLAPLMLAADFAFGAAGGTSWERICLGLPAAILTMADNQRSVATALQRHHLARWIGDARTLEPTDLRAALAEMHPPILNGLTAHGLLSMDAVLHVLPHCLARLTPWR
jgi:spore coat polysaccharide biosynthesis predicted glycosyltransferase SpsG